MIFSNCFAIDSGDCSGDELDPSREEHELGVIWILSGFVEEAMVRTYCNRNRAVVLSNIESRIIRMLSCFEVFKARGP